jgi:hypothetical protein
MADQTKYGFRSHLLLSPATSAKAMMSVMAMLQQLRTPTAKGRRSLRFAGWQSSSGEHNLGLRNFLYGASSFASPSGSVAFLEHSDRAVIGSDKQNLALRLWSDRKHLWPNGSVHAAFDTDFRSAEKARAARHT